MISFHGHLQFRHSYRYCKPCGSYSFPVESLLSLDADYGERLSAKVLVVSKKYTQKIKRKHLSLRTCCRRWERKGIRFSQTEQMHKIAIGRVINVGGFGYKQLMQ